MSELELLITEVLSELEDATFSLNFATGGLGVLVYILQALALYTIAKRRGINKPWLAWIPLVNVWILGSISDQYQYVVKRQVKNKRKVLLGLNIAIAVLAVPFIIAIVWFFVVVLMGFSMALFSGGNIINGSLDAIALEVLSEEIVVLLLLCLLPLPLLVLSIIQTVFFYMALYDVFCSSEPKNSSLYIVLSLVGNFVVNGVYALFLFLCKDKDLGMPPRKEEPAPKVIVEPVQAYDPWEN